MIYVLVILIIILSLLLMNTVQQRNLYHMLLENIYEERILDFKRSKEVLMERVNLGLPDPLITAAQAEKIAMDYLITEGLRSETLYETVRSAKLRGDHLFHVSEDVKYWSVVTRHRGIGNYIVHIDHQNGKVIGFLETDLHSYLWEVNRTNSHSEFSGTE